MLVAQVNYIKPLFDWTVPDAYRGRTEVAPTACLALPGTACHCLALPATAWHCLPLQGGHASAAVSQQREAE